MDTPRTPENSASLEDVLRRSVELDLAALDVLAPESYRLFGDTPRIVASFNACEVALDHARAIRTLMAEGFDTTAASIVRLQFEAVVRSMWLLWAASDAEVAKIAAPLDLYSQNAASGLPMASKMIDALREKQPAAYADLSGFKAAMMPALNSLVHAGIHALQRHSAGFPEPLMVQILRCSNGLFVMTATMLANLSGRTDLRTAVLGLYAEFIDCFPVAAADPRPGQA